jgi:uncharacterized protein HemY
MTLADRLALMPHHHRQDDLNLQVAITEHALECGDVEQAVDAAIAAYDLDATTRAWLVELTRQNVEMSL